MQFKYEKEFAEKMKDCFIQIEQLIDEIITKKKNPKKHKDSTESKEVTPRKKNNSSHTRESSTKRRNNVVVPQEEHNASPEQNNESEYFHQFGFQGFGSAPLATFPPSNGEFPNLDKDFMQTFRTMFNLVPPHKSDYLDFAIVFPPNFVVYRQAKTNAVHFSPAHPLFHEKYLHYDNPHQPDPTPRSSLSPPTRTQPRGHTDENKNNRKSPPKSSVASSLKKGNSRQNSKKTKLDDSYDYSPSTKSTKSDKTSDNEIVE